MSIFGGRKQQKPSSPAPSKSLPSTPPAAPAPPPRQSVGFETVLGANSSLLGDLKSQGNVRLDGTFEGTLEIDGNVLVGETAKITADIHAKNVSIAGAVRGNVSGKKVQLLRTGRVWGDISATAIATEEGAFIDGKITMVSHDAAQGFDASALPVPDEIESETGGEITQEQAELLDQSHAEELAETGESESDTAEDAESIETGESDQNAADESESDSENEGDEKPVEDQPGL